MDRVWLLLGIIGLGLQVAVLFTMTRGPYRRYLGVFVYLLVLFLTAVADAAAFLDQRFYEEIYARTFFYNNFIRYFAGFVAVVSLYFIATADHPKRIALRGRIILGSLLVVGLAYVITTRSPSVPVAVLYTRFGRNLAFITVLLNMVLWFALVKARRDSTLLLMVSGGLGLNMAGEAIGQALVEMGPSTVRLHVGNAISVLSHLLCLLIWFQAFRTAARRTRLQSDIQPVPSFPPRVPQKNEPED